MHLNVFAANITEFHLENQSGKAGDVVTVPVELTTGEEVGGFEIVVYYDNEVMEFQNLKKGSLIVSEGGLFDYNSEYGDGAIKMVYVVVDTVKAEGVIADISFKLKKDCMESLPIGVGIDKVIDGSEESKDIPAEKVTVTGTDETFQETVAQRAEEVREQRNANRESVDGSIEMLDMGSNEQNDEIQKSEGKNSQDLEAGVENAAKKEQNMQKEDKAMPLGVLIVPLVGAIAIVLMIRLKKKRKI